MELPKKLKIGAHTYKIEYTKANNLGNDRDGYHNPSTKTITVNNAYPESHQAVILFHEIFHALNGEFTEKEVEYLAQGITQVLLDNDMLK